jgi:oligoendopeptidase F
MNDTAQLGELPTWDLADLYPGRESPELKGDLGAAVEDADAFAGKYKDHVAGLAGAALGAALAEYERQQERLGRIMSYAHLVYAGNVTDPETGRFYQTMQEKVNEIATVTLFFELELRRIEEDDLERKCAAPELAKYRPWLRDMRAYRNYQLSDEVEKLLLEKSVAGRSSWVRLFDETIADLRFPFKGHELTETQILDRLSDPDGNNRREAAQSVGKVMGDNIRPFALITNTLAKDKQIEDRWRGFARPISARNLSNFVEDDVVDALLSAVQAAYPRLSHRYYGIKARWLGVDQLDYWDRNAPPPDKDDRIVPWNDARDTVLTAYGAFSGELSNIGKRFFDNAWIDAPVRAGKASGAFAHPTVPSAHPYLLLNYQGKTRDVMTLAHELGHGVHQVLAADQGHLMADTPLTLAETASVFGEMLTFQSMLKATDDPVSRRAMLAGKVEDMINTVVRQTAFCIFERDVHDARLESELTAEDIGKIWMKVQKESLGPVFRYHDEYRHYWAYIPHFIHSPFYVYAYAFGDCLVNALYSVYQDGEAGFADKYLEMLRAGGTLRHKELLAPFGLDATDPAFWDKGLTVVEDLIDELEATI